MATMNRTYLIQRLSKARGMDSPFAFGGGYKNGGLSDEAMDLIRGIWSFDYMGAAEFEFGAVPKALQRIAHDAHKGQFKADSVEIDLSTVEPDFRKKEKAEGEATIYILAHEGEMDEVKDRIRSLATERYNMSLKENTQLAGTLVPATEWDGETVGWLELDNGFMFFTDEEMAHQAADLFGIDAEA